MYIINQGQEIFNHVIPPNETDVKIIYQGNYLVFNSPLPAHITHLQIFAGDKIAIIPRSTYQYNTTVSYPVEQPMDRPPILPKKLISLTIHCYWISPKITEEIEYLKELITLDVNFQCKIPPSVTEFYFDKNYVFNSPVLQIKKIRVNGNLSNYKQFKNIEEIDTLKFTSLSLEGHDNIFDKLQSLDYLNIKDNDFSFSFASITKLNIYFECNNDPDTLARSIVNSIANCVSLKYLKLSFNYNIQWKLFLDFGDQEFEVETSNNNVIIIGNKLIKTIINNYGGWNYPRIEQSIGRAIRSTSHTEKLTELRNNFDEFGFKQSMDRLKNKDTDSYEKLLSILNKIDINNQ